MIYQSMDIIFIKRIILVKEDLIEFEGNSHFIVFRNY